MKNLECTIMASGRPKKTREVISKLQTEVHVETSIISTGTLK
ncbi:hypothetical protein OL548_15675 [Lysinibacillus sp. MHQ-1]|nr:hypothetical protein OL548_15675 [Lysinibacillus sp. MHQ-1]